ncbi:MAG TPA: hypothetical protein VFP10_06780 [Candidatus Eisenbacteria bacterium]|nr:hypothetical protein [Candidatus Eisenbacteria bacterium]
MRKTRKSTVALADQSRLKREEGRPRDAKLQMPETRFMTVVAQDPSVRMRPGGPILMARIAVPAEALVAGPMGYRVHVVDYDASARAFLGKHQLPVTYENEPLFWQQGSERILGDYRFHAQNVYALIMKTLARFEFALGRRIGWSFGTHQLKVAPHGMMDANAFYSSADEGIVFGYFHGRRAKPVYTCLSHDVVVHETTHALIDALRERYQDPSSPDQAAFHEGLSDVVALLSVFSQPELIARLMKRQGRLLSRVQVSPEALRKSALFGLAEEMGAEMQGARGGALRHSTDLERDPKILDRPEFLEPHRRGEVLVAAVMNGFIQAWSARIQMGDQMSYPIERVVDDGALVADRLGTMWIRALDYMPPVHLEFSDALSATVTADCEVRPNDEPLGLRKHTLAAFRDYGIRPAKGANKIDGTWMRAPGGLVYDRVRFESMRSDKDEVFRFMWENRATLGLKDGAYTRVLSVRPCIRIGVDGFTLRETVAEYYQVARLTPPELSNLGIIVPESYLQALRDQVREENQQRAKRLRDLGSEEGAAESVDADPARTTVYGGGVLIFDEFGRLKYHVCNPVFGKRQTQRLKYLWESGQLGVTQGIAGLRAARLATIHRMRSIDARRFPSEGW